MHGNFTRDISHWWNHMAQKDICITSDVVDFRGNKINDRRFRKVFDDNHLPNLYSAFSYFRYTKTMVNFFSCAKKIFQKWDTFRDRILKNCRIEKPTTDEVFAISATMIGSENCFIPGLQPTFTHMKSELQGLGTLPWTDMTSWCLTNDMDFIVGGYYQKYPFHYNYKDFATQELILRYEQAFRNIT